MSGLPLILVCISLLQIFFDIHRATVPWSTHVMNECFSHTDTVLLVIRWNRHFVVLIMAYLMLVRTYCSGTCYLAYTSLCDSRRVARILHWGAQRLRGCTFFSKSWRPFFVIALKTWALLAAGSIYLRYFRPTEHNTSHFW